MSTEDKTTDPLLEILAKVRSIDTRLISVENRLEGLETKVDERLRETRPIWEQALKEILDLRLEVKNLSRKQDILHDDILNVRADHRELIQRIDNLEHNSPTERIT